MKKKLVLLTAILMIFNTGLIYAATEEEVILANEVVEMETELELLEEDIDKLLDELEETLQEEMKLVDDEEIQDENLDKAIDEVLNLEEDLPTQYNLNTVQTRGYGRIGNIVNIIERQYNMKKQFIINTKEVYDLTIEIQNDLKNIRLEIKDVVRNPNRTIDKEAYGEIRQAIDTLKVDLQANNYIVGSITREVKNYIVLVARLEFENATNTFEQVVFLQDQQVHLLKTINRNIYNLKATLKNV